MLVSLFDYLSICRRYGSSTASCLLRGKPKSKIQYCTGYVTGRERVRGRKKRKKLKLKTRVAFNAYILSLSTLVRVIFIPPAIIDAGRPCRSSRDVKRIGCAEKVDFWIPPFNSRQLINY